MITVYDFIEGGFTASECRSVFIAIIENQIKANPSKIDSFKDFRLIQGFDGKYNFAQIACVTLDYKLFEVAKKHNADFSVRDSEGNTLLHLALNTTSHLDIFTPDQMTLLLELINNRNIDLNAKNIHGETALSRLITEHESDNNSIQKLCLKKAIKNLVLSRYIDHKLVKSHADQLYKIFEKNEYMICNLNFITKEDQYELPDLYYKKTSEKKYSGFFSFPAEIFKIIFSNLNEFQDLSNCMLVSKAFYNIVIDTNQSIVCSNFVKFKKIKKLIYPTRNVDCLIRFNIPQGYVPYFMTKKVEKQKNEAKTIQNLKRQRSI